MNVVIIDRDTALDSVRGQPADQIFINKYLMRLVDFVNARRVATEMADSNPGCRVYMYSSQDKADIRQAYLIYPAPSTVAEVQFTRDLQEIVGEKS